MLRSTYWDNVLFLFNFSRLSSARSVLRFHTSSARPYHCWRFFDAGITFLNSGGVNQPKLDPG